MIDKEKYAALHERQRLFFNEHITREIPYRLTALDRLREGIIEHEADIMQALHADLGKAPFESYASEIGMVLSEISYVQRHLASWAARRRCPTPLFLFGSRSSIHYEPRGLVLVIAPWNYPFNLALLPLVGAIAAGNCVVIKPSGEAPHTAACLQSLIDECFVDEYVVRTLYPHSLIYEYGYVEFPIEDKRVIYEKDNDVSDFDGLILWSDNHFYKDWFQFPDKG